MSVFSLLKVLSGSILLVIAGGALVLIALARMSRGAGDNSPVVGCVDYIGQWVFILSSVAGVILLLS